KILQKQSEVLIRFNQASADGSWGDGRQRKNAVLLEERRNHPGIQLNVNSLVLLLDNIHGALVAWERRKTHQTNTHPPLFLQRCGRGRNARIAERKLHHLEVSDQPCFFYTCPG